MALLDSDQPQLQKPTWQEREVPRHETEYKSRMYLSGIKHEYFEISKSSSWSELLITLRYEDKLFNLNNKSWIES